MKNQIFLQRILNLLMVASISTCLLEAQDNDGYSVMNIDTSDIRIKLDPNNPVNARHEYIDYFSSQDENYILSLYGINKSHMVDHPDLMNPAKLVKHSEGNNSLIFTVQKNGESSLDTLRNSLHPHSIGKAKDFLGIRKLLAKCRVKNNLTISSIDGKLPKGGMTWISPKRKKVKFGILIPNIEAEVKILILDKKENIISTVVDDVLRKGWNNYEWERGTNPKGKYKIIYIMDGQSMSQKFKC